MTPVLADYDLLDLWRSGDHGAGQDLFQRHFDAIYGFFETKCEADADELVQATFLACLRAKDQFRKESSFRTYLFTIARHELYRVLRTRQRDGERLDFALSSIAELVSTPATRIGRNQEHQRLVAALRRLPVDQQTLLELHYWEEMEIAELAAVFEAPAVTIRTRLHRARHALRELILKAQDADLAGAVDSLESMDAWAKRASRGT
jgi:RNA polymerase sigma factor (sigma-70 family)